VHIHMYNDTTTVMIFNLFDCPIPYNFEAISD
jgi:hypothetical protein